MANPLVRPGILLRVEGLTLLIVVLIFYGIQSGNWLLFLLLILAPDLSALGYFAGPRFGASCYNLFHIYTLPAALGLYGYLAGAYLALSIALIWLAHIGADRLAGYGLKYPDAFKNNHLGRV